MFKSSFNSIFFESGELKLDPDNEGHIFGPKLLVDRIPTFEAEEVSVQINRLLETHHDPILARELLHRVLGVSNGPVVMAEHELDAEQRLPTEKDEDTSKHFPGMHFLVNNSTLLNTILTQTTTISFVAIQL